MRIYGGSHRESRGSGLNLIVCCLFDLIPVRCLQPLILHGVVLPGMMVTASILAVPQPQRLPTSVCGPAAIHDQRMPIHKATLFFVS